MNIQAVTQKYDVPGKQWERKPYTQHRASNDADTESCSFADMLEQAVAHRKAIDLIDSKRGKP